MAASFRVRGRAFLIHALGSAMVVGALAMLIRLDWYPGALFALQGGWPILLTLVAVDVVLGPMLTFLVYVPGKKSLRFDLATIVVLQLAALVFGAQVLYAERPAFLAWMVDRFYVVTHSDLVGAVDELDFQPQGWRGGVRVVRVDVPADVAQGLLGVLEHLPSAPAEATWISHYRPFPGGAEDWIRRRGFPIAALGMPDWPVPGVDAADLLVVPVSGSALQGAGVLDARNVRLLDIVLPPDSLGRAAAQ